MAYQDNELEIFNLKKQSGGSEEEVVYELYWLTEEEIKMIENKCV